MTARQLTYISNARTFLGKGQQASVDEPVRALAERYRLTFWYARRRDALPKATSSATTARPEFHAPGDSILRQPSPQIDQREGRVPPAGASFSFYCTLRLMRDETPVVYTRHSLDVLFAPLVRCAVRAGSSSLRTTTASTQPQCAEIAALERVHGIAVTTNGTTGPGGKRIPERTFSSHRTGST
jgi:hypothetical protein